MLKIKSVYGQTFYCTPEAYAKGQKRGYVLLRHKDGSEKVSKDAAKSIHIENIVSVEAV